MQREAAVQSGSQSLSCQRCVMLSARIGLTLPTLMNPAMVLANCQPRVDRPFLPALLCMEELC